MNIVLSKLAHDKLRQYIDQVNSEISGIGQTVLSEDKSTITVLDVWIWEQECTGSTTEVVDHDSVFTLVSQLVSDGVPMDQLNLWWHSHANMPVFFSGTDEATIENWVNNRYLVSIVGNHKKEWKARVDIKEPLPCVIDDIPLSVYDFPNPELVAQIKEEIALKVKTKSYVVQKKGENTHDYGSRKFYEKDAENCLCDSCQKYLADKTGSVYFDFATHKYDQTSGMYIIKE